MKELLHDGFLANSSRSPSSIAIITGDREVTYGELADAANRVARTISETSLRRQAVGILLHKGWEQIAAVLGALIAGRMFVPMDMDWPSERILDILARTDASIVFTCQNGSAKVKKFVEGGGHLISNLYEVMATCPTTVEVPAALSPADPAYVIFTSGSTGRPKGVAVSHSAALNTIHAIVDMLHMNAGDRVLALSPLSFDLAIFDIFGTFAAGGTVVMPNDDERTSPSDWHRLVKMHEVSIWNSVPTLLDLFIDSCGEGVKLRTKVRACLLSGDWIPLRLPNRLRSIMDDVEIYSLGGATECSIWSIFYRIDELDESWTSIPYGRALAGQSVEVLDQGLVPCRVGVPGEICIGGQGLAIGYWGDPHLTDASFVRDGQGRRLYKTGDRGRLREDGLIEFLGRADTQVKVNGYRIELSEVEGAIGSLKGIDACAVVAGGLSAFTSLWAFYAGSASETEIRHGLMQRLPRYMVPHHIIRLSQLPMTTIGKIDRRELSSMACQSGNIAAVALAEGEVKQTVVAFASDLLGRKVASDSNLLSSGLTSVEVIRLFNRIHKQYGVRPSLSKFYRDPTITALSEVIYTFLSEKREAAPRRLMPDHSDLSPVDPTGLGVMNGTRALKEKNTICFERRLEESRYCARRSFKSFSPAMISVSDLGSVLEHASAVELPSGPKYLYPSAGGSYAIDLYILARPDRVDGMRSGLYRYEPSGHVLTLVVAGIDFGSELHHGNANDLLADTCAAIIFLVARLDEFRRNYDGEAHAIISLNSGYLGQLLCDAALQNGLSARPMHGFAFESVSALFGLHEDLCLGHMLVLGLPSVEGLDL